MTSREFQQLTPEEQKAYWEAQKEKWLATHIANH